MQSQFGFMSPTPVVTRCLIIIIGFFLLFALLGKTAFGSGLYRLMILDPGQVVNSGQLWRLISYAVLHDLSSPFHVIFNSLVLYMIGPQLELRWGEKRFFIFVIVSALLGGVFVVGSYILGLSYAYVVGFSAVTVGLIIAWGLNFSENIIYIFGIIPLSGKQLVYVTVGFEILYAVSSSNISSAAHFGGMAAGFILTLGLYKPQKIKNMFNKIRKKNSR